VVVWTPQVLPLHGSDQATGVLVEGQSLGV
jgi:hypothetical protein